MGYARFLNFSDIFLVLIFYKKFEKKNRQLYFRDDYLTLFLVVVLATLH